MADQHSNNKSLVLTDSATAVQPPSRYHVVLLNDDYTPMDFVVEILVQLFNKNVEEAHQVMLEVHHNNRGIAGTFPKEIAIEKRNQTILSAKANHFPLNCVIEPV